MPGAAAGVMSEEAVKRLVRSAVETGVLDLSHLSLTQVPAWVYKLSSLQRLHLNHNNLVSIDRRIAHLTALRILDISSNRIKELPVELAALRNCTINASGNQIENVPSSCAFFFDPHHREARLELAANPLREDTFFVAKTHKNVILLEERERAENEAREAKKLELSLQRHRDRTELRMVHARIVRERQSNHACRSRASAKDRSMKLDGMEEDSAAAARPKSACAPTAQSKAVRRQLAAALIECA